MQTSGHAPHHHHDDDGRRPLVDGAGIKAPSSAYAANDALAALAALFGVTLDDDTLNELTHHVIAVIEANGLKRDDCSVWRLTAQDLDDIAGRVLTDDELERIATAIDNSTAADAVAAAVEQVAGFPDDNADCEHSFNRNEVKCDSCGIDIREVP